MTKQESKKTRKLSKGQRRALLLLLIGAPGARNEVGEPIFGVTRLQKLLFLLKKEYDVEKYLQAYDFQAWRFGPFAKELYDDLEFLENLGLIVAQPFGPQTYQEEWEEDLMDKQIFLSSQEEAEAEFDADDFQGKAYRLTDEGIEKYHAVKNQMRNQEIDVDSLMAATTEVKSAYGEMPLTRLISFVYGRYPDYAEQSELKHLM